MKTLSLEAFQRLRADATVVEYDLHGDKVLRLADGTLLKLFRRKRLLSSAAWYPYAQRFADNCVKLAALGIPSPKVLAVWRVSGIDRHAVHYAPLIGVTVRERLRAVMADTDADLLRAAIGRFVAMLHAHGIFFRSLHFGNVVMTPGGELGLIDLSDLVIKSRSLGRYAVVRNIRHLMRYADEWAWLDAGGRFFAAYAASANEKSPRLIAYLQARIWPNRKESV